MSIIKGHSEALDNKKLDAIAYQLIALQMNTLEALLEISAEHGVAPDPIIETFIDGIKMLHIDLALSDLPE